MTRVLIDTNVIISSLFFPASIPAQALEAVIDSHDLVLTDQIVDELHRIMRSKRPDLLEALDEFLEATDFDIAVPRADGPHITDVDDQPIIDAAVSDEVDVIITGDKRFHALEMDRPRVVNARAFLDDFAAPGTTRSCPS